MKKQIFYLMIVCILLFTACQAEPPQANTQPNEPEGEVEPQPTNTPLPEPTETTIPIPEPTETPKPTPTRDLMRTSFSTKAHFLYNLTGGGPIFSMAWHPDNTLLANSGIDHVLVWDIKKLDHAFILEGHEEMIIDLDWSADGSILASLSLDETIRLWNAPDYQESAILNTGKAACMDWAPSGKLIAVGTFDGGIQLWEVDSSQIKDTIDGNGQDSIVQLDWSPDGKMLAFGDTTGVVSIWFGDQDAVTTSLVDPDGSPANDLAWSPNGQYLATAHENGVIQFWSPETWEIIQSVEAFNYSITKIVWSTDSQMIAAGGLGNSVSLYEAKSGSLITGLGLQTQTWSLSWSPNGKYLTIGSAGLSQPSFESSYHDANFEPNPEAGLIYFYIRK
jgi:WD40 repeat protein